MRPDNIKCNGGERGRREAGDAKINGFLFFFSSLFFRAVV